jgi:hypothetical protein
MSEEPQQTGDQNSEAAVPVDVTATESQGQESPESLQVPLDALKAERGERQRLQDELKIVKDNMQLMMAQQQQLTAPSQPDEFEGISKDDVITYGDLERILSKKEQKYDMGIQELRMTQKYPDYQEVVTTYLPEVLKTNPGLGNTLRKSNDYELAYHLAKNSDSYRGSHKQAKRSADAERIVQNAQRAGSLSSVGQTSPISEAKRWKEMSDSDFKAAATKNLGYC